MDIASETWEQQGNVIFSPSAQCVVCQLSEPRPSRYVEHRAVDIGSPGWKEAMERGAAIARLPELLATVARLNAEVERLRAEVAEYKRRDDAMNSAYDTLEELSSESRRECLETAEYWDRRESERR
ncbi:MAG: hypothetical protein EHM35_00215 [Planctomycetaceae bacterium]|nr:MAG: hypothetical protein EHM35_00215 [Planctomycetaceae bacterium]